MSIVSYTAGSDNRVYNASHSYYKTQAHHINISNNVVEHKFAGGLQASDFSDSSYADQAALYTAISFGSNVISVPWRSCYKFINLKSVEFAGRKVTSISNEAFYMCQSMSTFKMPDSVTSIGSSAFESCTSLASIEFPSHGIDLGSCAFRKSGLTSLNISTGNSVEDRSFAECEQLTNASVNGSFGIEMFSECTALTSMSITGKCTCIPARCFLNCSRLESITVRNANLIDRIEDYAFSGCSSMTSSIISQTSVSYVGAYVFSSSGVSNVVLPATITSPSQINSNFLAGSYVTVLKFMGMTSDYMESHKTEFSSFGKDASSIVLESSSGKRYQVDEGGLVISPGSGGSGSSASGGVYIISVAISNNIASQPLQGCYLDSGRFINLVMQSYTDSPDSIVGITRLNDEGTSGSNGLGTKENIDNAFAAAKESGADFVMFHFSDHGASKTSAHDGYMYLYGGVPYTYADLFAQFRQFKYAFALLCCCYPYSCTTPFDPGPNKTKALFWAAGAKNELTYLGEGVGHKFLTYLINKFNSQYTWQEQFDKIHKKYFKDNIPHQYSYGDFPMSDKVFRIDR